MAPTSIEFEAPPLVASAHNETAETSVRLMGSAVAKKHMIRHQNLLEYLKSLVAKTCPKYLANDQDDVVQTLLIRLDRKLGETMQQIESCRRLLEKGRDSVPWIAKTLKGCLEEAEKAWDRDRATKVKKRLKKALAWAREEDGSLARDDVLRELDECLEWLRGTGGKEVYSKAYIYKGVHWAILDAKQKLVRLAEVSPEEREDGSREWDRVQDREVPGPRTMVLREEISDCLGRLDEAKRRPTFLALLGYEYNEIAVYFGLSLPQADSRIRRGKAFLRRCLNLKGVSP